MDKVEKKAFWGALLLFAFILIIGWKLRSRNFYYAMDICEVLAFGSNPESVAIIGIVYQ